MSEVFKCDDVLLDCNQKLDAVLDVSESILEVMDPNEILNSVIYKLGQKMGFAFPAIFLFDENRKNLLIKKIGVKKSSLKILKKHLAGDVEEISFSVHSSKNIVVRAALNNEMLTTKYMGDFMQPILSSKQADLLAEHLNIKQIVAIPLSMPGRAVGVLVALLDREELTVSESMLFQTFANQISIAIKTAELFTQIHHQNLEAEKQKHFLAEANARLQALDEAKSDFISIASHQLRTPLTSIKGFLSLLIEGSVGECDSVAIETIKKVASSTDRLVTLVNELLDISKIERGILNLDRRLARLEIIAESAVDELLPLAQKKKLQLNFHRPRRQSSRVKVDREKIRSVMMSMLDNAIKYTPQGKIDVFIKCTKNEVKFVVKDTGLGLSPHTLPRLFEKFSRGEGVSVIDTEGVGLGLFVAKRIIDAHEGKIWASSKGKGKGSEFIFSIPISKKSKK